MDEGESQERWFESQRLSVLPMEGLFWVEVDFPKALVKDLQMAYFERHQVRLQLLGAFV